LQTIFLQICSFSRLHIFIAKNRRKKSSKNVIPQIPVLGQDRKFWNLSASGQDRTEIFESCADHYLIVFNLWKYSNLPIIFAFIKCLFFAGKSLKNAYILPSPIRPTSGKNNFYFQMRGFFRGLTKFFAWVSPVWPHLYAQRCCLQALTIFA
jgi:hypothetical protein